MKEYLKILELRGWAISFRKQRIQKLKLTLSDTHGVEHWDRVYGNGKRLLEPGVDDMVVSAFAYTHDLWRNADGQDLEHGPRAAEELPQYRNKLSFLNDEEFELLREACRLHTVSDATDNPTLNVCFDADRLDIGRVGIIPDPEKMCTPKGKILAQTAPSH